MQAKCSFAKIFSHPGVAVTISAGMLSCVAPSLLAQTQSARREHPFRLERGHARDAAFRDTFLQLLQDGATVGGGRSLALRAS